jgi:oxalate decarboxylase/phosphoglucose isomerase-like protein (cupin superfamily)
MSEKPTIYKPGKSEAGAIIREIVGPEDSHIDLMTYNTVEVTKGFVTTEFLYPAYEVLFTCTDGSGEVVIGEDRYKMTRYDMMYVPENTGFQLVGGSEESFCLGMAVSPSDAQGAPVLFAFEEIKDNPANLRKMPGRDVYITLDEDTTAGHLVGGLVFFEPYTRSFPPHKHSDQEEIYHFIGGHGSMEVFPSEEGKTFVHNVEPGTIITIPLEHYHPVFAQEEPVAWIWIIAGARYWVGDKDSDWMEKAKVAK